MCISRRYPMKVLHTQGVINTRPALLESKAVSTGVALRQRLQQRLGLLQVGGVKALREPAIDRRQQRVGLGALALLLPQATQAHGGPELQRLRLLAAGDVQSALQPGFRLRWLRARLPQEQDALEATDFCFPAAVLMLLDQGVGLGQRLEAVVRVAQVGRDVRQHSA